MLKNNSNVTLKTLKCNNEFVARGRSFMKIVLQCPKCLGNEFTMGCYGAYAKCEKCGNGIFIKDSEFEFDFYETEEE